MVDENEIEKAVLSIIKAIGENPKREGLLNTPKRVAKMCAELLSGVDQDPKKVLEVGFEEKHYEMVILKDIFFSSVCEHHFLPFYGKAHIGYIPNSRVVGASKLARVVETLAKRPQIQERLTSQIADTIFETLKPQGVGVVVSAEHLCMIIRGIKKPGSRFVTSAMRGVFKKNAVTRSEFLSLIQG
jgi:GTP cyclohydrolase I